LSVGFTKSAAAMTKVWLRKKTMDLCASESEEYEQGFGACVILLSSVMYPMFYIPGGPWSVAPGKHADAEQHCTPNLGQDQPKYNK
jgi:hypothetical protein